MLVSQIDLSKGINGGSWGFPKESRVEIPNCDSLFIIHDENSRANYIEHYGDVEVIYEEKYCYYKVPAFEESRRKYSEAKQIECNYWGCE